MTGSPDRLVCAHCRRELAPQLVFILDGVTLCRVCRDRRLAVIAKGGYVAPDRPYTRCSSDGCEREARYFGLCPMHHDRVRRAEAKRVAQTGVRGSGRIRVESALVGTSFHP